MNNQWSNSYIFSWNISQGLQDNDNESQGIVNNIDIMCKEKNIIIYLLGPSYTMVRSKVNNLYFTMSMGGIKHVVLQDHRNIIVKLGLLLCVYCFICVSKISWGLNFHWSILIFQNLNCIDNCYCLILKSHMFKLYNENYTGRIICWPCL
jgi:hypothetical protein